MWNARQNYDYGWLRELDKKRKEANRVNRLNSLRQDSRKPLPAYAVVRSN